MELWFSERHTDNFKISIRIKEQLFSKQSDFQKIDIYDTFEFGRMLVMDGAIMLTEKDEFIYHEMITHPALSVNPAIQDVLVIGGGDGGTINQLCRYPQIRRIDVVEIDQVVVEASRQYLPFIASAFADPRVNVRFTDGLKYVRQVEDQYDLVIVDSTDPFGPGESLFTREFYGHLCNALRADGIALNQHESPYFVREAKEAYDSYQKTTKVFPKVYVYQANIPTYPAGHWLFGFLSKKLDPLDDFKAENWEKLKLKTRYYNVDLHRGAFALPTYVKKLLQTGETL